MYTLDPSIFRSRSVKVAVNFVAWRCVPIVVQRCVPVFFSDDSVFCTTPDAQLCAADHRGYGTCNIGQVSRDLPQEYQNFEQGKPYPSLPMDWILYCF